MILVIFIVIMTGIIFMAAVTGLTLWIVKMANVSKKYQEEIAKKDQSH